MYLSEKYVHIDGCQKVWAMHIAKSENRAIHILSLKMVIYHIPGGAEFEKRCHAQPYYIIYRELPPVTPPPPRGYLHLRAKLMILNPG